MTEQELLRTALILPPRARAVLCVWAAIPGLLCAPFVFWQSLFAGLCFCAVWGLLVLALRLRACSFVAALSPRSLTVQAGIAFPVLRQIPRRACPRCRRTRWLPSSRRMPYDRKALSPVCGAAPAA